LWNDLFDLLRKKAAGLSHHVMARNEATSTPEGQWTVLFLRNDLFDLLRKKATGLSHHVMAFGLQRQFLINIVIVGMGGLGGVKN
jgi:hypothetical protein